MTASAIYNRPLHNGNWASSLIWGRTRSLEDNSTFNSYALESTLRFFIRNHVWTRIENAERSNELLLGENPLPRDAGCTHIMLEIWGDDRTGQAKLFGDAVLPHFKR